MERSSNGSILEMQRINMENNRSGQQWNAPGLTCATNVRLLKTYQFSSKRPVSWHIDTLYCVRETVSMLLFWAPIRSEWLHGNPLLIDQYGINRPMEYSVSLSDAQSIYEFAVLLFIYALSKSHLTPPASHRLHPLLLKKFSMSNSKILHLRCSICLTLMFQFEHNFKT